MAAGDVIDLCGFEAGAAAEEGITATTTGGTSAPSTTQKRTGAYAWRVNKTSGSAVWADRISTGTPAFPTGKRQLVMSFWLYIATLPSAAVNIASFQSLTSDEFWLDLSSGGVLTHNHEGADASASVATLSTGQWYRIEMRANANANPNTAGSRVNAGTEQTTSHAVPAGDITGWRIGTKLASTGVGTATYDLYYDDLVIYEGTAYESEPYAVRTLTPNADTSSNWTITGGSATRAEAIDERPSDTTTTYISSTTSGQTQTVELDSYTLTGTESIKAISTAGNVGSNGTTGTRTVAVVLQNSAGTDGTSGTWNASVNGWLKASVNTVSIVKPSGGAWTQSEMDGLRIKFTKSATADEVRVGNAWAYAAILGTPSAGAAAAPRRALLGVGI